jgi:hypothetical protein
LLLLLLAATGSKSYEGNWLTFYMRRPVLNDYAREGKYAEAGPSDTSMIVITDGYITT